MQHPGVELRGAASPQAGTAKRASARRRRRHLRLRRRRPAGVRLVRHRRRCHSPFGAARFGVDDAAPPRRVRPRAIPLWVVGPIAGRSLAITTQALPFLAVGAVLAATSARAGASTRWPSVTTWLAVSAGGSVSPRAAWSAPRSEDPAPCSRASPATRSPADIIGVTAGASAPAVFAIVMSDQASTFGLAGAAAGGAMATALVIYALVWRRRASTHRLVLDGIGLGAALSSGTSFLLTRTNIYDVQRATLWLTGSLNARGWDTPASPRSRSSQPVALAGRHLRVLELGDDLAVNLGLPPTASVRGSSSVASFSRRLPQQQPVPSGSWPSPPPRSRAASRRRAPPPSPSPRPSSQLNDSQPHLTAWPSATLSKAWTWWTELGLSFACCWSRRLLFPHAASHRWDATGIA